MCNENISTEIKKNLLSNINIKIKLLKNSLKENLNKPYEKEIHINEDNEYIINTAIFRFKKEDILIRITNTFVEDCFNTEVSVNKRGEKYNELFFTEYNSIDYINSLFNIFEKLDVKEYMNQVYEYELKIF